MRKRDIGGGGVYRLWMGFSVWNGPVDRARQTDILRSLCGRIYMEAAIGATGGPFGGTAVRSNTYTTTRHDPTRPVLTSPTPIAHNTPTTPPHSLFSYAAHMAKTYALQITRSLGVVVMRYLNILFGACVLFFPPFLCLVFQRFPAYNAQDHFPPLSF